MLRFLKRVSTAGGAELLMCDALEPHRRCTVHNYDWVKATQALGKSTFDLLVTRPDLAQSDVSANK